MKRTIIILTFLALIFPQLVLSDVSSGKILYFVKFTDSKIKTYNLTENDRRAFVDHGKGLVFEFDNLFLNFFEPISFEIDEWSNVKVLVEKKTQPEFRFWKIRVLDGQKILNYDSHEQTFPDIEIGQKGYLKFNIGNGDAVYFIFTIP